MVFPDVIHAESRRQVELRGCTVRLGGSSFALLARSAIVAGVLVGTTQARADALDSSQVLYEGTTVRTYRMDFYRTDWSSALDSLWKSDSGYLPARFSDGERILDSVGVRYKGNSSYTLAGNSPKKPFKIKFNEYRSQTYFGAKVLNFSNGIGDPTFLREKIAYDIARTLLPAPRASFVDLVVGADTLGLYTQVEQVDKTYLKRWFPKAGGDLFKAGDDGAPLKWLGEDTALLGAYEHKTNEAENDHRGLLGLLAALDRDSGRTFCVDWRRWIDADNVGKILAFNMVLSNFDSYTGSGRNYYLYQETDSSAFTLLPWDVNLAFGGYSNGWNVTSQDLLAVSNLSDRPLMRQVVACDTLRWRYLYWVKVLVEGAASADSVQEAIARSAPVVRPHVVADRNKFYPATAFESNLASNYKPSPSTTIPGLRSFSQSRNAVLAQQVASYLPEGYQANALGLQPRIASAGPALVRSGGGWKILGMGSGPMRLEILSPSGRLFASREVSVPDQIQSLPSGLWLVRLRGQNQSVSLLVSNF